MTSSSSLILQHYIKLTEFLGKALGPDYEVALHDLTRKDRSIIAIANNYISGREVGAPLTNMSLSILRDKSYERMDYHLHYYSINVNGKALRSSTFFIKDSGKLIGLLCINFDASRYEELSRRVMELCGGGVKRGVPSGTRLIADGNDPVETPVRSGYPTSIAGATASIVSQVVANYPVEVDRLTQDEKMEIMDILNRKGVFLLKGSVSHVAQTLHSSEASIYRYLGKLNNK